eukprot:gene1642-16109_t
MADKDNYGISEEAEKKEYFESPESLSKKLDHLAELLKDSSHAIVFTGAGLSTSTGIPDFRSGMNTVLPTGPGVWELRDKGVKRGTRKEKTKSVLKAMPSSSHMAIVQLHQSGMMKMLVSQNTDGLHLRSGMNPSEIAELHGNTNLETCCKCGALYLRDFRVRTAQKVHDHFTGRFCDEPGCRGRLKDSIINFGEDLPEKELSKAYLHAEKADLCIVLGTSLRVSPANEIPRNVARHGKLVICNLQKTPLDSKATLLIHAFCDDVMIGLMQRLELPIPKWELVRRAKFTVTVSERPRDEKKIKVLISGLHPQKETPFSIFKKVVFKIEAGEDSVTKEVGKEPFAIIKAVKPMPQSTNLAKISCELIFHGHYEEPSITLKENVAAASFEKEFLFYFDPTERSWRTVSKKF